MRVDIKLFASLREQYGFSEKQLEVSTSATVRSVWQMATQQQNIPENVLAAINHEYVDMDTAVNDTDEVAFFPPVTGG